MPRVQLPAVTSKRRAWNKGRIIGQKRPLLPKQVWAIRARLELAGNLRDLALFNVAIDSKLRGCDLLRLRVSDLRMGSEIRSRAKITQHLCGSRACEDTAQVKYYKPVKGLRRIRCVRHNCPCRSARRLP